MLPDPPPAQTSALTWFVGYQNTSWLYVLKRLNSLTIKNWKWKITRWFSSFDSFDHSPPVPACGKHQKIRTETKTSGILGIQEGKKKKKYWTNVKTTPNMDRVMGTWFELLNKRHMIKNTELEFEHRTDISCDKLERILFPPYIFIESRRGK